MTALIDAYLKALPDVRRSAVRTLRKTILDNLPKGYEEAFNFGMLTYQVPLSIYPDTYNKKPLMYVALASQKSHLALYLCNAYGDAKLRKRLESGFKAARKKIDMGKACLRFQSLDDVAVPVIADVVAATPMKDYVAFAKAIHSPEAKAKRKAARTKASSKKRSRVSSKS